MADAEDIVGVHRRLAAGRGVGTVKAMLLLFVIVLFTNSSVFAESVIAPFGGASAGGRLTLYGGLLQGVVTVVLYILATHLAEIGVF